MKPKIQNFKKQEDSKFGAPVSNFERFQQGKQVSEQQEVWQFDEPLPRNPQSMINDTSQQTQASIDNFSIANQQPIRFRQDQVTLANPMQSNNQRLQGFGDQHPKDPIGGGVLKIVED